MKSEIAILFDLGNVLLPIDLSLTYQALANYSEHFSALEVENITIQESLWVDYESGLISDQDFRDKIIQRFKLSCSNLQFDQAFNALLKGWHDGLYPYLAQISQRHDLYLLSNTSHIHSKIFLHNALGPQNESVFSLFKRIFLSFEMALVKPNPLIYHQVLTECGMKANQVLFFDDNLANIESAREIGFMVEHIYPPTSLEQIKLRVNLLC